MIDWARVSERRGEVGEDVEIAAIVQSYAGSREVFINQSAERLAA